MATTAKWELSSIDGSEAADQIDERMAQLCTRLDWLLGEHGADTIQAAGIGTVSKVINYSRDYGTAPAPGVGPVRATFTRTSNHDDTIMWVTNETDTSFTINLRTLAAGTAIRSFRWAARPSA